MLAKSSVFPNVLNCLRDPQLLLHIRELADAYSHKALYKSGSMYCRQHIRSVTTITNRRPTSSAGKLHRFVSNLHFIRQMSSKDSKNGDAKNVVDSQKSEFINSKDLKIEEATKTIDLEDAKPKTKGVLVKVFKKRTRDESREAIQQRMNPPSTRRRGSKRQIMVVSIIEIIEKKATHKSSVEIAGKIGENNFDLLSENEGIAKSILPPKKFHIEYIEEEDLKDVEFEKKTNITFPLTSAPDSNVTAIKNDTKNAIFSAETTQLTKSRPDQQNARNLQNLNDDSWKNTTLQSDKNKQESKSLSIIEPERNSMEINIGNDKERISSEITVNSAIATNRPNTIQSLGAKQKITPKLGHQENKENVKEIGFNYRPLGLKYNKFSTPTERASEGPTNQNISVSKELNKFQTFINPAISKATNSDQLSILTTEGKEANLSSDQRKETSPIKQQLREQNHNVIPLPNTNANKTHDQIATTFANDSIFLEPPPSTKISQKVVNNENSDAFNSKIKQSPFKEPFKFKPKDMSKYKREPLNNESNTNQLNTIRKINKEKTPANIGKSIQNPLADDVIKLNFEKSSKNLITQVMKDNAEKSGSQTNSTDGIKVNQDNKVLPRLDNDILLNNVPEKSGTGIEIQTDTPTNTENLPSIIKLPKPQEITHNSFQNTIKVTADKGKTKTIAQMKKATEKLTGKVQTLKTKSQETVLGKVETLTNSSLNGKGELDDRKLDTISKTNVKSGFQATTNNSITPDKNVYSESKESSLATATSRGTTKHTQDKSNSKCPKNMFGECITQEHLKKNQESLKLFQNKQHTMPGKDKSQSTKIMTKDIKSKDPTKGPPGAGIGGGNRNNNHTTKNPIQNFWSTLTVITTYLALSFLIYTLQETTSLSLCQNIIKSIKQQQSGSKFRSHSPIAIYEEGGGENKLQLKAMEMESYGQSPLK